MPRVRAGSTWMPGAHRGRERDLLDVAALRGRRLRADDLLDERRVVLESWRSSKLFLPIDRWTFAPRSVRYSSLPAFASRTALATSNVTVPVFGFGIRPRGPRMRPSLPTLPIWSGVAIATSKSVKPSSIALGEVGRADDVRAGLLRLARLLALGEDGDAHLACRCRAGASASRAAAGRRGGR